MVTISAVVDTNIFLRHLLGDIPDQSIRANRLFSEVMSGDVHIYAPSTLFFEVAYVLTRSKGIRVTDAANALRALLDFPGFIRITEPRSLTHWSFGGPRDRFRSPTAFTSCSPKRWA